MINKTIWRILKERRFTCQYYQAEYYVAYSSFQMYEDDKYSFRFSALTVPANFGRDL
jgi:hypothetical protein